MEYRKNMAGVWTEPVRGRFYYKWNASHKIGRCLESRWKILSLDDKKSDKEGGEMKKYVEKEVMKEEEEKQKNKK